MAKQGPSFDTNLSGFRHTIGDYTRAHMFRIVIPDIADHKTLTLFARSTKLPDYVVEKTPIAFQGLEIRAATVAKFEGTWDVTFLADEAQTLRRKFLEWSAKAYDGNQMLGGAMEDYVRDNVVVQQLTRTGLVSTQYNFFGLWPEKVGGWELGHDKKDVTTFTVTFSYDFFGINTKITDQGNTTPVIDTIDKVDSPIGEKIKSQDTIGRVV